jgi:hypothetical protein
LPHEGGGAPPSGEHLLEMDADRAVQGEVVLRQFRVAKDHHEDIVEVVGHAPGQGPQGLHFLGLPQLVFQVAARGDVTKDQHEAVQRPRLAPNRRTTVGNQDVPAVAGDQDRLRRRADAGAFSQHPDHGTLHRLAGLLMHEL